MRVIDLSVTLDNDKGWVPRWARNRVKRQDHRFGRLAIRVIFRLRAKHLQTGLGWANDLLKISTHGTTHLDAPWHYGPESEGKPARTIDQIPLEWCYGNGVCLDMRHKGDGEAITVQDVQQALEEIDYSLQAHDIVLIQTGNDRLIGDRAYFDTGTGMSAEATEWIVRQGVKVTGIDSWGWDIPLRYQAEEAKRTDRNDVFWAAHYVGIRHEYCHMERLANLDQLPPTGFKVCCFPLKVAGGSAGPARVVALVEE